MLIKVSSDISNMDTLNSLLEDEKMDSFEKAKKMNITDITALRLHLNTPFKFPFVATEGGHLKFQGSLLHKTESQAICFVSCTYYSTKVYFGKGFLSTKDLLDSIPSKKP